MTKNDNGCNFSKFRAIPDPQDEIVEIVELITEELVTKGRAKEIANRLKKESYAEIKYEDHLNKSEKMINSKAFQKWDKLVQDCFKKMTEDEIDEFGIRSSYGRYQDEQ